MAFDDDDRRNQLYGAILEVLGDEVVGLWGFEAKSGTTVSSSARTTIDFTPKERATTKDLDDFVVASKGLANSYQFNIDVGPEQHVHEWMQATSSPFSFNDGTTDKPFSVGAWVFLKLDAVSSTILAKSRDILTERAEEWHFQTLGTDGKISHKVMDSSENGGRLGKISEDAISPATWHFVVGTYDGSELVEGLKIYHNGTEVSTTDNSAGTYGGMVAKTEPAAMGGIRGEGTSIIDQLQGRLMLPFVTGRELSAADVWSLFRLTEAFVDENPDP